MYKFDPFFCYDVTSRKLAEKAKNVLAIKILFQNLKKSTFKL